MKEKKESKISRFGVSLQTDLLNKLDACRRKKSFSNRSQIITHIIEEYVSQETDEKNRKAVGVLVIIYDHHKSGLMEKLISYQHQWSNIIISTNHIHLDKHFCLESISLQGYANELKSFSDAIITMKGIKKGKLVLY